MEFRDRIMLHCFREVKCQNTVTLQEFDIRYLIFVLGYLLWISISGLMVVLQSTSPVVRDCFPRGASICLLFFSILILAFWFCEPSIKNHSGPVNLLRVFGAPYYGMASEGLLSLHHRLQIHCIVNVNTCRKGPDDKTIVFCRSLQILT